MSRRISLSFDESATPFVVRCFGLRIVDGRLKRPLAQSYEDVKCCVCKDTLEYPEMVGGFFSIKDIPSPCCSGFECLAEADKRAST